ncbi:hypothetical protein PPL_01360 [Heterostelium album PN500]|uniref:Uncharacterized protein n=1 Tax=Heterostelium pallidum (strain ATCC 26659 / Pp 5 / PN500) TaxID=670386 RepID=D3AZ20_HETP5|nr:hypothetical protein PPL_01360 [Heterostelium album PN500]EFA85577.1 hypothetical protein PPL_01360 [Heterostelium album PN500]|eukprot:XP_020437684.1 hypothetical protein PPL_01360 [Heterostelium album PN500]
MVMVHYKHGSGTPATAVILPWMTSPLQIDLLYTFHLKCWLTVMGLGGLFHWNSTFRCPTCLGTGSSGKVDPDTQEKIDHSTIGNVAGFFEPRTRELMRKEGQRVKNKPEKSKAKNPAVPKVEMKSFSGMAAEPSLDIDPTKVPPDTLHMIMSIVMTPQQQEQQQEQQKQHLSTSFPPPIVRDVRESKRRKMFDDRIDELRQTIQQQSSTLYTYNFFMNCNDNVTEGDDVHVFPNSICFYFVIIVNNHVFISSFPKINSISNVLSINIFSFYISTHLYLYLFDDQIEYYIWIEILQSLY